MRPPRRKVVSLAVSAHIGTLTLGAVVAYFALRAVARYLPSTSRMKEVAQALFMGLRGEPGYSTGDFAVGVIWLLLAAGALAIPAATWLMRRPAYASIIAGAAAAMRRRSFAWALRVGLIAALAACSMAVKSIDLTWDALGESGPRLALYSLGRLGFAAGLAIVCVGLGAWLMAKLPESGLDTRGRAILAFFLGTTVLAILGVVLGVAGLIHLPVVIVALTLAAWLAAPPAVSLLAKLIPARARGGPATRWRALALAALGWCIAVLGACIAISYGAFPFTLDNDVWEHYLHYYSEVLRHGSSGPNDVWYHYFLSKGAGLFFLAASLTDVFAAQLVTLMAIGAAAFVIYDLLMLTTHERAWAMFGVLTFFAFLYGTDQSAMFFKHHGLFLSYSAFLCWAVIRLGLHRGGDSSALTLTAGLTAGYLGFYLPGVALLLVAPMLAFSCVFYLVLRRRGAGRAVGLAGAAVAAGAALALILNYTVTGLAEMVPMRLFWRFADQLQFDEVIGTSGVNFFLATGDFAAARDLSGGGQRFIAWFLETLRLPAFAVILSAATMVISVLTLVSLTIERRRLVRSILYSCIPLVGLAVPAVLLAWFTNIDSVRRLYVFMAVVWTILGTWGLWVLKSSFPTMRSRALAGALLLTIASIAMVLQATQGDGQRSYLAGAFSLGALSLEDALTVTDRNVLTQRPVDHNGILQFRKRIGREGRALALTYEAGFAYFLPQPGVISEPSYSAGPKYAGAYAESPARTKERLTALGVDYILLNLRAPIASGFGFTQLFSPQSLAVYFRVVHHAEDLYVLGWADRNFGAPIPVKLAQVLELKQAGVMRRLFTPDFVAGVRRAAREAATQRVPGALDWAVEGCGTECKAYLVTIGARAESQLQHDWRLSENAVLVQHIRASIGRALAANPPYIPGEVPKDVSARRQGTSILMDATMLSLSQAAHGTLTREFGQPIADILTSRDERFPYVISSRDGL